MQKRLHIKSKELKKNIRDTGRKGAKKDFFTLLKLAINSNPRKKITE